MVYQSGRCFYASVFALLLLSSWSACQAEVILEPDIVYGQGGDVDLKLDLARPKEGDGPFPGLVLIHGGGWSGGNRESFRPLMQQAAERGYVAVTISYR